MSEVLDEITDIPETIVEDIEYIPKKERNWRLIIGGVLAGLAIAFVVYQSWINKPSDLFSYGVGGFVPQYDVCQQALTTELSDTECIWQGEKRTWQGI
jgi:hypothetical protein